MKRKRGSPRARPAGPGPVCVVGIGASAGGLEAFEKLFSNLPFPNRLAVVVMQHQTADGLPILPGLLQTYTRMPVIEAADGMALQAGRVHVAPAGPQLVVHGRTLRVGTPAPERRPTIDLLFESIARGSRGRAVGVVLSGTGADGARGLTAIREGGGLSLVQEPLTAAYDGMPRAAISAGRVDHVLAPEEIGALLVNLPSAGSGPARRHRGRPADDVQVLAILELVRSRTQQDFAFYRSSTVRRRLQRRMAARHVKDLPGYLELLRAEPEEADCLASDLVIGVTRFFRDRGVWDALRAKPLRGLLADSSQPPLRVWVAGCSTGEEAYTMAICISMVQEQTGTVRPVEIFATDLSQNAIRKARVASYPLSIANQVPPDVLARFFVRFPDHFRVMDDVREMVTFAQHDLLEDPPFGRLDLISCRNVLIYMDARLQGRLLDLFHYALRTGGTLLLGSAESATARPDAFEAADAAHRIFRRAEFSTPRVSIRTMMTSRVGTGGRALAGPSARRSTMKTTERARRLMHSLGVKRAALVDENDTLVYLHGDPAGFLEPTDGAAGLTLTRMLPPHVAGSVEVALAKARLTGAGAETGWIEVPGQTHRVQINVEPVKEPPVLAGLLVVSFHETAAGKLAPDGARPTVAEGQPNSELARVRKQLSSTRDLLAGSGESVRRAVDDAVESRQELQAATEELQSTNEELETTKEELLAVNQEMEVLNADLKRKMAQLNPCRTDLEQILADRSAALLCLDSELRVQRFSPGLEPLLRIRQEHLGAQIGTITSTALEAKLASESRHVVRTREPRETLLRTQDGRWIEMRVAPARDSAEASLLVTLTDISAKRLAFDHMGVVGSALDQSRRAVAIAGGRGDIEYASRAFEKRAGKAPGRLIGTPLATSNITGYSKSEAASLRKAVSAQAGWSCERRSPRPAPAGTGWESVQLTPVKNAEGVCVGMVMVLEDITERKSHESGWRGAQRASQLLPAWMSDVLTTRDPDEALRAACRTLVDSGDYQAAWAVRCASGSTHFLGPVARRGQWRGCPPDLAPPRANGERRPRLFSRVVTAGEALVARDLGSIALLALKNGELVVGILAIRATDPDGFGETELRLLSPLAGSLGRRLSELAGTVPR